MATNADAAFERDRQLDAEADRVAVDREYLWALEVLTETVRDRRASRADYQRARRIVGEHGRVTGGGR